MTILYLIIKEFKQILRSIYLPVVYVTLPVLVECVIVPACSFEVKGLEFCVIDKDHSVVSQQLIQKLDASKYMRLTALCENSREAMSMLDADRADFIVEIPRGYERDIVSGRSDKVMLSANGVNGVKAGMAQNYVNQIVGAYLAEKISDAGGTLPQSELPSEYYLFNPELRYELYMVPGIIGLMIFLVCCFMPALNLVGEKDKGTIEQINVTPINRWQFVLSKIIPYLVVGLFMFLEALLVSELTYGFHPKGSTAVMLVLVILFTVQSAAMGVIIGNYAETIHSAALTAFFFLELFFVLSGSITPVSSMPQWAQGLSAVIPLRYFSESMRAVFIKGSMTVQILKPFAVLLTMTVLTVVWAVSCYRKSR